jgi:hypothetical protein
MRTLGAIVLTCERVVSSQARPWLVASHSRPSSASAAVEIGPLCRAMPGMPSTASNRRGVTGCRLRRARRS